MDTNGQPGVEDGARSSMIADVEFVYVGLGLGAGREEEEKEAKKGEVCVLPFPLMETTFQSTYSSPLHHPFTLYSHRHIHYLSFPTLVPLYRRLPCYSSFFSS